MFLFPLPPALSRCAVPACGLALGDCLALTYVSGGFRCPEHISGLKNPAAKRISAFSGVLCLFPGITARMFRRFWLDIVVRSLQGTIRGMDGTVHPQSAVMR